MLSLLLFLNFIVNIFAFIVYKKSIYKSSMYYINDDFIQHQRLYNKITKKHLKHK